MPVEEKKNYIEKEIGEKDLMTKAVGVAEEVVRYIESLVEEGRESEGRSLPGLSFHFLKFMRPL